MATRHPSTSLPSTSLRAGTARGWRRACGRQRGFTLVELLIVMAIIVVMAAAIVPRMGRSISRQNLVEATARLAQTCRTVRELAVASGRMCAVELDMDAGSCVVTRQTGSGKSSSMDNAREVWLKPQQLPQEVKVASCRTPRGTEVTAGRMSVRFFPDGRSDGVVVRLVADAEAYDVVVHPQTGRVAHGKVGEYAAGPEEYDLGDG
jgi:type II secretion system protein H